MIDLHTHTNYSDGTWDLKRLLSEAQNIGIEILSITDHDTLKAYSELNTINYKSVYNGRILPGVELSVVYDGIKFELLAYGFDYDKLNEWICETYENKEVDLNLEFENMYNSCKSSNIKVGDIYYDKSQGWPVDIIFKEIKKYKENKKHFSEEVWNDIGNFYKACITNKNFPVYVDFSIHFPSAEVVAQNVRQAGGKIFLAHAFKYNLNDTLHFIDILRRKNIIDGVEVYHSSFNAEEIKSLEIYCANNHLLMSGGSDCHGNKEAIRKMGIGYGNLDISKDIIKDWNVQTKLI